MSLRSLSALKLSLLKTGITRSSAGSYCLEVGYTAAAAVQEAKLATKIEFCLLLVSPCPYIFVVLRLVLTPLEYRDRYKPNV